MPEDHSDCAQGINALNSLPTEAAEEFRNWRPDGWSKAATGGPTPVSTQSPLTDAERRYLRAVIDHPGQPSSSYGKLAGVGTHQAGALRKRLVKNEYLREHRVHTGSRGRASIVLEPLAATYAALGLEKGAP